LHRAACRRRGRFRAGPALSLSDLGGDPDLAAPVEPLDLAAGLWPQLAVSDVGTFCWVPASDSVECDDGLRSILDLPVGATVETLGDLLAWLMPDDRARAMQSLVRCLRERTSARLTFRIARLSGEVRWIVCSVRLLTEAGGRPALLAGVCTDFTAQRAAEERLRRLVLHDALTGLANRLLLQDRLEQALARARRAGHRVAVMVLDLDNFKEVNDTLGHAAGDRLLTGMARRLEQATRREDTFARLGGDEFALVQGRVEEPVDADVLARKVLAALDEPFDLDGRPTVAMASVGIALFPEDGDTSAELLRHADLALYRAKAQGGGRHRFFRRAMAVEVQERERLGRDLGRALEADELLLHYQPQLDLRTGRTVGAEALLRWHHGERGLVMPGIFVPVAEASRQIWAVGEWVLDEACRQAAVWRDAGLSVTVAVNLAPAQLRRPELLRTVAHALRRHDLEPARLELEVECGLLVGESRDATGRLLGDLAERGVRLAVTGFGAGAPGALRGLPVQTVKIARSLVGRIGRDADCETTLGAMVDLAHGLGLRAIAEGVERQGQLVVLQHVGCDAAQGFHLARPGTAKALFDHLRRPHPELPRRGAGA
jgi:diguanylate cyclase (GGDEF)-like protein